MNKGQLIISVVMIGFLVLLIFFVAIRASANGESYQKGNNTVANVTAIHDMNNEQWYGKDNPMRLVYPNTYEWSNEDLDCKIYNDCEEEPNPKIEKRIVVIEQ